MGSLVRTPPLPLLRRKASGGRGSAATYTELRVIHVDRPELRRHALAERAAARELERMNAANNQPSWRSWLPRSFTASAENNAALHALRPTSDQEQQAFADNVVISAKYSVWNFAPRVLLAQLKRPSNMYFLFIAALQTIKEVSNTSGVPTILLPLTIVFVCSAIKEALEDRERHRADAIANSKPVLALNAMGQWELTQWGNIRVGDIVKVLNNQTVPADLFLLSAEAVDDGGTNPAATQAHIESKSSIRNTSEITIVDDTTINLHERSSAASSGTPANLAYVETKSLDGETNLKIRTAIPLISAFCEMDQDGVSQLRGCMECELPNNRITTFEGEFSVYLSKRQADQLGLVSNSQVDITSARGLPFLGQHSSLKMITRADSSISIRVPVTAKQMLLRSCVLRNTQSVVGMAVFTGHETKVNSSNTEPVIKTSSVEERLNALIVGVVLVQQLVCFLGALIGAYWMISKGRNYWYLIGSQHKHGHHDAWTTADESFPMEELIKLHLRYFIIMQNFVPISLNVSLEFVKYWQAYFIEQDLEMYDEASDTPATVNTSALNEDLGRVHHIFTDKTGTLTMNMMLFRYCMIGNKHYGGEVSGDNEVDTNDSRQSMISEDLDSLASTRSGSTEASSVVGCSEKTSRFVEFDPTELFSDLHSQNGERAQQIQTFLRHLALCHTLIPARPFAEMCTVNTPEYSASSPDEQALVSAAAYCNVRFVHRTPTSMMLMELGNESPTAYRILNVLEFDSDRKRMSIIVETPTGEIELLCKGADNVILERLAEISPGPLTPSIREVHAQLSRYATCGMRTLCMAHKRIDRATYDQWHERFMIAHADIDELVKKRQGLANAIDPLMNEMEQDLVLLGVTAVQDKLQLGVPRALIALQQSNMKIWTLTGDKMETAINIGYACSLLSDEMEVKKLCAQDVAGTSKALHDILTQLDNDAAQVSTRVPGYLGGRRTKARKRGMLHTIWLSARYFVFGSKTKMRRPKTRRAPNQRQLPLLDASALSLGRITGSASQQMYLPVRSLSGDDADLDDDEEGEPGSFPRGSSPISRCNLSRHGLCALVIDGPTLEFALRSQLRETLYKVTKRCPTVICCRVSPKQKAEIVECVREFEPESITLAIGDGANDVGMIQAAHIGVGISGQEGTQAVNASDYSIAQFRFLQRLLFVHGRWAYRRVTKLMSYMLYKNVTYVLTTFWFGCFCGFSGQPLIIDIAAQSFNVLYTSIPLVLFAVFDQDISPNSASKFPNLYALGQKNVLLRRRVFWPWILNGIWHSLIIFFISAWAFEGDLPGLRSSRAHPSIMSPDGKDHGLVTLGFVVFTNLVIVVNAKLCLETFKLTWQFVGTIVLSILLWPAVGTLIASPNAGIRQATGEMTYLEPLPSYWLLCVLVIVLSLVRDSLWKIVRRVVFPSTYHILQEREMLRLTNSPRSMRLLGQSSPFMDYAKKSMRSFESAQETFLRSSPLAESLIPSSGHHHDGQIRVRGSFHGGGSLSWDDDEGEFMQFSTDVPRSFVDASSSALIQEAATGVTGSLGRDRARQQYHGYAFSEDENVDSDVEAASTSGKVKRPSATASSAIGSAMLTASVGGGAQAGGRALKKMLKTVRGQKNA